MGRLCLGLAEERLVPFEASRHIVYTDDRPRAFHDISPVGGLNPKELVQGLRHTLVPRLLVRGTARSFGEDVGASGDGANYSCATPVWSTGTKVSNCRLTHCNHHPDAQLSFHVRHYQQSGVVHSVVYRETN